MHRCDTLQCLEKVESYKNPQYTMRVSMIHSTTRKKEKVMRVSLIHPTNSKKRKSDESQHDTLYYKEKKVMRVTMIHPTLRKK